ncbi:MAG: DNA topoisomerase I, partial [Caldiserica bacterium]|nr:DNA topoisomerase I [Caldisericota bacterium]
MAENIIIVESPSKAKTISRFLSKDFTVCSSLGHVKDLPKAKLGVDIENGFQPTYKIIRGKRKIINSLKKLAKNANAVYLASDPDREGEAIAWHIAEELKEVNP